MPDKQEAQIRLSSHEHWRPNFSQTFLKDLAAVLGIPQEGMDRLPVGLTPEKIFYYTYAIFHSPGYRSRYAEFLKIDFPRLPLTPKRELFADLSRLGSELVAMHLLESPELDSIPATYTGPMNSEVEKVLYSRGVVWLDKAQTRGFRDVSEAVWDFQIGGYQVCEKWLKDRKGRTLSNDDIAHYQKIVVAVSETIRLMVEIDKLIEAHGGWPGAFQTAKSSASARN